MHLAPARSWLGSLHRTAPQQRYHRDDVCRQAGASSLAIDPSAKRDGRHRAKHLGRPSLSFRSSLRIPTAVATWSLPQPSCLPASLASPQRLIRCESSAITVDSHRFPLNLSFSSADAPRWLVGWLVGLQAGGWMAYAVGQVPAGVERITKLEMTWVVSGGTEDPIHGSAFCECT